MNEEKIREGIRSTGEYELYPNPATDFVTVNADEDTEVLISSTDGLMSRSYSLNSDNRAIDIRDLRPGRYVIAFSLNSLRLVKHLIKELLATHASPL